MKTIDETDSNFICDIQAPCFQKLTPEESEVIKGSKTQVLFRKGDHLTKQGTYASYVLFIIKGLVIKYIEGDNSKDFNLRILQPGDFVALTAVFTNKTFNYSSIALTDCQAYLIELEAITTLARHNGSFGFGMINRYCEENTILYESLRTILYKQMNGRIAGSLLYIDTFKTEYRDIFQWLSRKDIAGFAGVSTESAVKLLKSFEKDGLIKLKDKDIHLMNHSALMEIAKRG